LYPGIEFSQSCVHFTPGILHSSISMRNDEKRSCVSIWFPVLYRACHFVVKRNFACLKDSKSYATWGFCPLYVQSCRLFTRNGLTKNSLFTSRLGLAFMCAEPCCWMGHPVCLDFFLVLPCLCCLILYWLVPSRLVLPYRVVSCLVLSCLTFHCRVCFVSSCLVLFCLASSFLALYCIAFSSLRGWEVKGGGKGGCWVKRGADHPASLKFSLLQNLTRKGLLSCIA